MSHFAVAVLSEPGSDLNDMLAPYQEGGADDGVPVEYLEFEDEEDSMRREWEEDFFKRVRVNGNLISRYDPAFRKPDAPKLSFSTSFYEVPEHLPVIDVPIRVIYPDFDEYARQEYGYDGRDPDTGRYGSWENPNAKWDWWVVGGRWRKWAEDTIGGVSVRVGDITFDAERQRDEAASWWAENMDVDEPSALALIESRGMTMERYIDSAGCLSFRAVVTPDGKWHEVGSMGWFGISSESEDEMAEWEHGFTERFLDNPDLILTVVDCHI